MAGEPETLDSDEPLARRRHRHAYDRLLMLSDGVFSIALTLLAFDFTAPAQWASDPARFWSQLAIALDAYAMSVVVIGVYWLAHKRLMAMILTADPPVTVLNLVMLALVALVPAATRFMHGKALTGIVGLVYAGLVIAIGLTLAALWAYAALIADIVSPEVPRPIRWCLALLMAFTPPLFLFLTSALPNAGAGMIPGALVILFLVGWRLRLLVIGRMARDRATPIA